MRFNKLDLNLLVALDAMLADRSISRAAERMHMSQSAMSSALARLRDYFDDELLVQVGRKMELTPRAETLREAVRDVLLRVQTTIGAQPGFDASQSDREFSMFISDYSMATLIPHLLALTALQAPSVRFRLLPQVEQPLRALEHGEVDMLLLPRIYCSPDHPSETLFTEVFRCVVWSEGRFRSGELTAEQYAEAGHVVMQPPAGHSSFESGSMQRQGVSRRVEITSYSFIASPYLVVGTNRIAMVHRRLAEQAQKGLPLRVLTPPVPVEPMDQVVQWHKYRSLDPGLVWLRQMLAEAARRMDDQPGRTTT